MTKTKAEIRILLCDDHPVVREGLKTLLQTQSDMNVVGEAEDGRAAVSLASQLLPDIIIMDLSMPGMNGLEATRLLKQSQPETKIVVLTFFEDETYMEQAAAAGANGYITKRAAPNHLIDALRLVAAGKPAFGVGGTTPKREGSPRKEDVPSPPPVSTLSEQELRVARLIAEGLTNREIAAQLQLDSRTVEEQKKTVMEKLGLRSRAQLAKLARDEGWIRS